MFLSQTSFVVLLLLVSFVNSQHRTPASANSAQDVVTPNKMLILRTFATSDYQNLIRGFESWNSFDPCSGISNMTKVDILLFFSAPWSSWPEARVAAEFVSTSFHGGNYSWAHCFDRMYLGSAMIPLEEDLYDTRLMGVHELWVNGPNRQFERAMKVAGQRGYEVVYLMESDSQPVQVHWLDSLLAEIDTKSPFAVLGRFNCKYFFLFTNHCTHHTLYHSAYKGDKWYDFYQSMPVAMKKHING